MKKLLILPIFAAIVLSTINTAWAAPQVSKSYGTVSVSSSATKEVDPNIAEISFSVETTAKTADIASIDNKKVMNEIINVLKPKINESTGDSIKTSNYSVRPNYNYSKDGKQSITGYTAVNTLSVKTKNVSQAGTLIDAALSKGANRLDGLSFSFENTQSLCNDLYPQIVKDAQGQASVVARALNQNVVGLKSINTSCSTQYSNARPMAMMKSSAYDSAAGAQETTPVEPGKIKVYASINAEFKVE